MYRLKRLTPQAVNFFVAAMQQWKLKARANKQKYVVHTNIDVTTLLINTLTHTHTQNRCLGTATFSSNSYTYTPHARTAAKWLGIGIDELGDPTSGPAGSCRFF